MGRPAPALEVGAELGMTILGTRHGVTAIPKSLYDPENLRLKS
jgi:hypothetical protein